MKKKTLGLAVLTAIMMMNLGACAGCNRNDTPVITTPTAGVTATVEPTIEPTAEPEYTPTVVPTPTEIPATPTPIPTPEPTATPVPTKAVAEGVEPIESVKMGENVWYDFYDDGTLIVRGTGKTRDVDASFLIDYEYVMIKAYTDAEYDKMASDYRTMVRNIVVEEGITELGDWSLCGFCFAETVTLPTSLTKIGYAALFDSLQDKAECIGLREDVELEPYAIASFGRPNETLTSQFKEYAVAPSLKPRPTATPLPNPDKPRLVEKKKMGDNITYEFWDNGYLYVKGTGATWDQSFYFDDFAYFNNEFYQTIENVIIDEGVTYFGDFSLNWLENLSYWQIPKSLTGTGNTAGGGHDVTFDCYINGKPATVKTHNAKNSAAGVDTLIRIMSDIDAAIAKGYEIIYH